MPCGISAKSKTFLTIFRSIIMKASFLFRQYTWLIETILNAGKINFQSISEKWKKTEMSGGLSLARTSFNRQRDAVLDMFGIIIECDRSGGNRYYIANENELRQDSVQNWMFSTISVSQLLSERNRLFNRIIMERVPSADVYLKSVLCAMYDNRQVSFVYHKYESDAAREFTACPYCLKLFNRRWYAAMAIVKDGVVRQLPAIFSLDRIKAFELLPEKFKMPKDFNAIDFFNECFGVVVGDGTPPTHIRLRAFGRERFAMHDLPIHHSQTLVAESADSFDFEVYLRPTADFKAFLASKGQWLIALSPKSLANDVIRIHEEAIEKYRSLRL